MTDQALEVTGGVDTHGETHHAAVVDRLGRHLADREFKATGAGYRQLLSFGSVTVVGGAAPLSGQVPHPGGQPGPAAADHRAREPAFPTARTVGRGAGESLCPATARRRPRRPVAAVKAALRRLGRRILALTEEIDELEAELKTLTVQAAPELLALKGVGADVAGQLLATAGDNPDRLKSEAAFAHLCGVAPIPASSGRRDRHRLNRGGDRAANHALHTIVLCRMRWDERTRAYVERRTGEGLAKKDIMRCLKRHIAREVYRVLMRSLDRRIAHTQTTQSDLAEAA